MSSSRSLPACASLAILLSIVVAPSARGQAPAQDRTDAAPAASSMGTLPPDVTVVAGSIRMGEDGSVVIDGPVTITKGNVRFQADRMTLREERWLAAEGNVLVVWESNRIFGDTMAYDLETGEGTITNAIGQVDPEYQFTAAEVRKVGDKLVYLRKAEITTCTQPSPYWSFRVSKARVRIDGYARMWNARFRIEKVPILYFPFLFWPVKQGRAPGLLLPEIGTTQNRGQVVHQPVFVPLGRSADVTITPSYFSLAGTGVGAEFRAVPNRQGRLAVQGFYISDQVSRADRWRFRYEQTQQFRNGFRMLADIDAVSDFEYYNDYERDIEQTSLPNIRGRLEFARNGKWTSMNVRQLRNEQLFSDGTSLVQATFPEIEWRGRSRQLGRSPLYLSFESSFASILQDGVRSGESIDADYVRGDVYPTFSMPWSPTPWLDINPTASYRYTYWTQSVAAVDLPDGTTASRVVDDDLDRGLGAFGVELIGPRFYRIFGGGTAADGGAKAKYKHVVEPTVAYRYSQGWDEVDRVLRYDEIDPFGAAGNVAAYGVRSRLFAKRPRSTPTYGEPGLVLEPQDQGRASTDPFGDRTVEARMGPDADGAEDEAPEEKPEEVLEPVEIASISLTQSRSFDRDLSSADLDGDGVNETFSSRSEWALSARYNPLARTSFDLRAGWQPIYKQLTGVTVSGSVAEDWGQLRFSVVHRNGLGVIRRSSVGPGGEPITELVPRPDDTQVNLFTAVRLWGGRVRVGLEGTYDFNPPAGQSRVPNRLWSIQYSTQCCTFLFQRLARDFSDVDGRDDYTIRIDLRGVGKILDQRFR